MADKAEANTNLSHEPYQGLYLVRTARIFLFEDLLQSGFLHGRAVARGNRGIDASHIATRQIAGGLGLFSELVF